MMSDTSLENEDNISESIAVRRIKSIMCVPLIGNSEIMGALYVHSINVPHGFRKEDLFLLTCINSPAALAIESALLYSKRQIAEEALKKTHAELEERVEDRTADLSRANALLKQEIADRKQTQEKLKETHEQLKETNKRLELAYAQMRDWKDRLSMQLYGEEIGFLTDKDGVIQGVTEKAQEITGRNRIELLGTNIVELVDKALRKDLKQDIGNASWMGISHKTPISIIGNKSGHQKFQTKLMYIDTEIGTKLLVLMRPAG